MPLDMVVVIMKSVMDDGFVSFFNLFKAWGQAKKASEIIHLLEHIPVCDMYPLRLVGNDVDMECYDRFFSIAEGLQVADAVLYRRAHDLLMGVGNVYVHLMELDVLAARGHFLSMVAAPAFRILIQKELSMASMIPCFVKLYMQDNFRSKFVSSVNHLHNIRDVAVARGCALGSKPLASCPIHDVDLDSPVNSAVNRECVLCDVASIFNAFRKA
ncbi:hypothetical protein DCAR_0414783 [Daucus carota subsp. sativus]|uniref:Uncharacterized protein n=1 Tax=Daucus carota subsp. sativus TaxID=79200 RepID=A0A165A0N0_DAUCS|nr:hypothetical protein DCAR_0414783 [Daucus carota subsp. sativus]